MQAPVHNLQGIETGSVELSDAIFGRKWSADLVHQVVVAQAANARRPWAHAKGRGEVRGGGVKPWRQKGTGRARHGSIRSPLWKGGGASHGPVKDRDFSQKINKKMLKAALYCVLSQKLKDGELKFVDSLKLSKNKTKELASGLKTFLSAKQVPSTTIVASLGSRLVSRAASNLPKVQAITTSSMNITELLRSKYVVIEQEAVKEIK